MKKYTPSGEWGFAFPSLSMLFLILSSLLGTGWGGAASFLPPALDQVRSLEHGEKIAFTLAVLGYFIIPLMVVWYLNKVTIAVVNRGLVRNPKAASVTALLALSTFYLAFSTVTFVRHQDVHLISYADIVLIYQLELPHYLQYVLISLEFSVLAGLLWFWAGLHAQRPFCEDCLGWIEDRETVYYSKESRSQLEENFAQARWTHSLSPKKEREVGDLEIRLAHCAKGCGQGCLILREIDGEDPEDAEELAQLLVTSDELKQFRDDLPMGYLNFISRPEVQAME